MLARDGKSLLPPVISERTRWTVVLQDLCGEFREIERRVYREIFLDDRGVFHLFLICFVIHVRIDDRAVAVMND